MASLTRYCSKINNFCDPAFIIVSDEKFSKATNKILRSISCSLIDFES